VEIEFIGKLDGTGELTERSFAPVVPCGVTDRLALALTLDCQGVTLSGDVEASLASACRSRFRCTGDAIDAGVAEETGACASHVTDTGWPKRAGTGKLEIAWGARTGERYQIDLRGAEIENLVLDVTIVIA
jgi:hypothetical protein